MSAPRTPEPEPQWQPITQLPAVARIIDEMLAGVEEQYQTPLQARPKPHVLDDYTVNRVISSYTTQRDDLWLFEEQLGRWAAAELTESQRREVTRVSGRVERLRQVMTAILELAEELKSGTIDRMLAKSDLQVGLEYLLGHPIDEDA